MEFRKRTDVFQYHYWHPSLLQPPSPEKQEGKELLTNDSCFPLNVFIHCLQQCCRAHGRDGPKEQDNIPTSAAANKSSIQKYCHSLVTFSKEKDKKRGTALCVRSGCVTRSFTQTQRGSLTIRLFVKHNIFWVHLHTWSTAHLVLNKQILPVICEVQDENEWITAPIKKEVTSPLTRNPAGLQSSSWIKSSKVNYWRQTFKLN